MKDIRRFQDYISLKDVTTRSFLMISELIDNAIGSFDDMYGEGNWKEKLIVDIIFYFDNDEIEKINGVKTQVNSYIKVIDNAFGVKKEKLSDAISLNKKNDETSSKMHRHGRGMKQCAFYFGADLTLETWRDDGKILGINLLTSNYDANDEVDLVQYEIKKEDLKELSSRGTCIRIDKIYSNKSLDDSKFDDLKDSISYRYMRLISSGNLELRYTEDIFNKTSKTTPYKENKEPIQKVHAKFGYLNEDGTTDTDRIERKIRESIEEAEKAISGKVNVDGLRSFPKYPELIRETSTNIANVIRSKNSDDKFIWEQVIDVNGKKLPVKFWMLKDRHTSFKGYRVYEGDRALMHPPMTDDGGARTYYERVFPRGFKTGSTDNIFAGEFDILDINATTSTDKSKFNFEDSDDEYILNEKLRMVWEVFNIFVRRGRNDSDVSEGKKIKKDQIDEIESVISTKFSGVAKNIDVSNNYIVMDLIIEGNDTWQLNIEIDGSPIAKKIWDKNISISNDKKVLSITAYSGHKIWKRIDDSVDFLAEALIPITIFIAHYEIMNIIDGSNGKEITMKDIEGMTSAIEMMNESGKIIIE